VTRSLKTCGSMSGIVIVPFSARGPFNMAENTELAFESRSLWHLKTCKYSNF
jgi:hypothetical protein